MRNNSIKKNKLVIFDLGNTLIHYHRGHLSDDEKDYLGLLRMSHRLENWKIKVSVTDLIEGFYKPWIRKTHYRSQKKTEYNISDFLSPVLPLNEINSRRFNKLILDFFEPTLRLSEAGEKSLDTLKLLALNDFQLAVLSNSPIPGYCHDKALEMHGLLSYISFSIYSYDIGIRKPSLEIFIQALKKASCNPANAFMVGDSKKLDIFPAVDLGINTILYSEKKSSDADASNFKEVGDLILEYFERRV